MASILFCVLIGMGSNIDNIEIGLSYGIRGARIPRLFYMLSATISFLACVFGSLTAFRIGQFIPASSTHLLGSYILVCIGLWTIIKSLSFDHVAALQDTTIEFSEMMFIGLAQALTDLSIGFGTGFAGLRNSSCVRGQVVPVTKCPCKRIAGPEAV